MEEKRLPPEVEGLAGGFTDGLPGCEVKRDAGWLALWRYQVRVAALPVTWAPSCLLPYYHVSGSDVLTMRVVLRRGSSFKGAPCCAVRATEFCRRAASLYLIFLGP